MKPVAVKLQLPQAVGAVRILDVNGKKVLTPEAINDELKKNIDAFSKAMTKAVEKVNLYGQNLFAIHRTKIVSLAVQIAARILAKEIEQGQYALENIITQAISEAPAGQILEIRLNPADLKTGEEFLKNTPLTPGQEIKLTADTSVGRAECVIRTPEGILESRIAEHLKQIEAAMQSAT